MKFDFRKSVRQLLSEQVRPNVLSYIQALSEDLESFRPRSLTEVRRLEIAKENLKNIKYHFKRMQEQISFLEEEVNLLKEKKNE